MNPTYLSAILDSCHIMHLIYRYTVYQHNNPACRSVLICGPASEIQTLSGPFDPEAKSGHQLPPMGFKFYTGHQIKTLTDQARCYYYIILSQTNVTNADIHNIKICLANV